MSLRRAAIFGGTFDPVHNGHLEAARRVLQLFGFDQLIFVPALMPPHKRKATITSPFHRFAMLTLATEDDAQLRVSTVELDDPKRPYAVETIARVQQDLGPDWRIFFVMGADSWLEITTWHEWQRLLTMCDQVVVTRPGHDLSVAGSSPAEAGNVDVRGLSEDRISELIGASDQPRTFISDAVTLDVSATAIRAAARAREYKVLRQMVPPAVAGYIEKYELYSS
jgi:nicotinate-nucleotide adenylyltransferase